MIRELAPSELDKLIPGAVQFYETASLPGKFNIEIFKKNWEMFFSTGIGMIFVLVDEAGEVYGGIGCVRVPDLMTDTMIASEMFWYVMEGKRGEGMQLLRAFESWAKASGCNSMRMMHLSNVMPEELRAVYRRRGYREVEVAYEKEVG